jgi:hypothetical protein
MLPRFFDRLRIRFDNREPYRTRRSFIMASVLSIVCCTIAALSPAADTPQRTTVVNPAATIPVPPVPTVSPASPAQVAAALPDDPFQRCAVRALRGDFGKLQSWQERGYQLGIKYGAKANTKTWNTCFYGTEASGRTTRWAGRCSWRTCAANRLPAGAYVWHEKGNLRVVEDTGAHSNDSHADRLGCEMWVDWWAPCPGDAPFDTHVARIAVIRP